MNYPKIDKPTMPGQYWYQAVGSSAWLMMEVFTTLDGLWIQPPFPMPARPLSKVPALGNWRGPIPEPTP